MSINEGVLPSGQIVSRDPGPGQFTEVPKASKTTRGRGSWEAEHVKTPVEKERAANVQDPRAYPKSHDQYDLAAVTGQTRDTSGFALVGYWVPPKTFEGRASFQKLFGTDVQATKGVETRDTVGEYNKRTGEPFIVTPLDVRKEHLPMLKEFREMSLKNLQDVYGFEPGKDKVEMYLHFPIYGDATAGLHVHVRVNQGLPAGEADANSISFDKLLSVLEDDSIPANAVHQHLLDSSAKTRSGQHLSFSAAWGKDQFEGLGVGYAPNPWKRP